MTKTAVGADADLRPRVHRPVRLGLALALGAALWIGPFMAFNAVLLPARIEQIDPTGKVGVIALLAIAGSVVAMLSNILFGALSDITRSRFGRRTPWLLIGSLGASASLIAVMNADTVPLIVLTWCAFQLFLNIVASPLLAIIADRVPAHARGTYSAVYGVGSLVGITGAQIVAAGFVTAPEQGMIVFAVVMVLAGPVVILLAPERSNRDEPRQRLSGRALVSTFAFPLRNARDFYFALGGKFGFMLGTYTIAGYQLYILTDYIGVSTAEAGGVIAGMAAIQLVTSAVFGAISGPISDKLGRRKAIVIAAMLLVAVGSVLPFFVAEVWAMYAYAILAGVGMGVFISVDQALNTDVLPSEENSAKDLGILNMANTGGQIAGPVVTSAIVAGTGTFGPAFIVAAAILVGGAGLILPIKKVR
ncbi:MFS transporter [Microbacterium sp. NPDC089189]|uniref:MFS transporter n=1 Tax=Microbacterium sp. NPDC089189 TaxID=3154972 RepID=UPI00342D6F46